MATVLVYFLALKLVLQENAGNDPNTQLVPSGGTGGWQKPDSKEDAVDETAPILAAGSSWASGPQTSSGVPSWQPPQPFPVAAATATAPRSLNPHEYPSLSAAASTKQSNAPKQAVSHLPSAGSQVHRTSQQPRTMLFWLHTICKAIRSAGGGREGHCMLKSFCYGEEERVGTWACGRCCYDMLLLGTSVKTPVLCRD